MKTLLLAAPPWARIASRARTHVRRVGIVADHLEREIGLDARADVERAGVDERPAAMVALDAPQIDGDQALELEIGLLAAEMAEQHVFGRDGRVGLELEAPVAVLALRGEQRLRRRGKYGPPAPRATARSFGWFRATFMAKHSRGAGISALTAPDGREIDRAGLIARAYRAFDGRRQAGLHPVAGEDDIRPVGCAEADAWRPAPGSRRRSRASP